MLLNLIHAQHESYHFQKRFIASQYGALNIVTLNVVKNPRKWI